MNETWWWWLALAVSLALAFQLAWYWLCARWRTWRRRRQAQRARRGEARALLMLERLGYTLEAEQPAQAWPVIVGERACEIKLRADFLVRHSGQRFVAEVKTGNLVASIQHGPTRRQLLEYQLAYGATGVVLVDVLGGSVLHVRFPRV